MDPAPAADPGILGTLLGLAGSYGTTGLCALFVLLVFTGRLVPASTMRERVGDKQVIIDKQDLLIVVLERNNNGLLQGNQGAVAITRATGAAVGVEQPDV